MGEGRIAHYFRKLRLSQFSFGECYKVQSWDGHFYLLGKGKTDFHNERKILKNLVQYRENYKFLDIADCSSCLLKVLHWPKENDERIIIQMNRGTRDEMNLKNIPR